MARGYSISTTYRFPVAITDKQLAEDFVTACAAMGMSRSAVLVAAMREYVKRVRAQRPDAFEKKEEPPAQP